MKIHETVPCNEKSCTPSTVTLRKSSIKKNTHELFKYKHVFDLKLSDLIILFCHQTNFCHHQQYVLYLLPCKYSVRFISYLC